MTKKHKLRRLSLINLIAGYAMLFLLILLVSLNRAPEPVKTVAQADNLEEVFSPQQAALFNGSHRVDREIVYADRHPVEIRTQHRIGRDRLSGVVLDDISDVALRDDLNPHIGVVDSTEAVVIHPRDNDIYVDNNRGVDIIRDNDTISHRTHTTRHHNDHTVVGRDLSGGARDRVLDDDIGVVDIDGFDRAVNERHDDIDTGLLDRRLEEEGDRFGIDPEDGIDLSNLTLAKDNDDLELGDIDTDFTDTDKSTGYGLGETGELYAYDYPSRGVGAGIGSSALGAGAGGGAGIGAGVGEAVYKGQTVPALGGIGTSRAMPLEGQPEGAPPSDGVGGLTSGAGAGGAAGLVTGTVTEKLGLGIGVGNGRGDGVEGGGNGRDYNYDHLPKDGALHIMIHVDGSGSILATRKQLDIMKDTLLKDALLPYYNNDEGLYNRRVTIVDDAGERTLQFFSEASKKDNVLAVAFQDEAAPDYHLPNFNKHPQDAYSYDLGKLKASLNGYSGLYRGIMFQVDRGRTFAKSFKELVECAWRGEGYLENANLKRYYRDNNPHHIKNKDGIVFSDEYHAKSEGDPQYYLDLIFAASKRVGLDLNIYSGGLRDGIKWTNPTLSEIRN